MTKLHIIAVAHNRDISLRILVDSFICQTNPNWQLYVIHDGEYFKKVKEVVDLYTDYRVMFLHSKTRNGKYGHPNRKFMLERMPSCEDFVLMTNDDNYYVPSFVEEMLSAAAKDVGIVYCDTVHSHYRYNTLNSLLKEGYIDMGAFIVRLDMAKKTGFNHTEFSADGMFAEEAYATCVKNDLRAVRVPKALFVHN